MDCACGHELPPQARFCSACGAPVCPCGAPMPPGARFCPSCGAPAVAAGGRADDAPALAPGERRLVTVLFADMAGSVASTRDLDPEEAADRMNVLLGIMGRSAAANGGHVDRYLGDGMLAVFGVPQAREDDALRAVRCALEIQAAAQAAGIGVTAGINTGEVYLGAVGGAHQETTVMGPAVNLAARLQGAAAPGELLVGSATYRTVAPAVDSQPVDVEIKGLGQVEAFRIDGLRSRLVTQRGLPQMRAAMVGRDGCMKDLQACLERVRSGTGCVVTVRADAGLGKSRLLAELRGAAGDVVWLQGHCHEMTQDSGLAPFIDLLQALLDWPARDDEARWHHLCAWTAQLAAEGHLSREPAETAALLGRLLSLLRPETERLAVLPSRLLRDKTLQALRDVVLALSKRGPAVVALEDLHWADDLSRDALSGMFDALNGTPLLLVLATRPQVDDIGHIAHAVCPDRHVAIDLQPLAGDATAAMLTSILGAAPQALVDLCREKAQGNPLYVEEIVRTLIEEGKLVERDGAWHVGGDLGLDAVPDTVKAIISARVDRLPPHLRGVLQDASVLGRTFDRDVLGRIVARPGELEQALKDLASRGMVEVQAGRLAFHHVLIGETVYGMLLKKDRAKRHLAAAAAIEASRSRDEIDEVYSELAFHYDRGGHAHRASRYHLLAGRRAAAVYHHDAAARHFERGLELESEQETRHGLLADFGEMLLRIGDARALGLIEEGLATATGQTKGNFWLLLGDAHHRRFELDKAAEAYQEAHRLLPRPADGDRAWHRYIHLLLQEAYLDYWRGQPEKQIARLEEILPDVERHGLIHHRLYWQEQLLAAHMRLKRYRLDGEGMAVVSRLRDLAIQTDDEFELGKAHFMVGFAHLWRDELDQAERFFALHLKNAETTQDALLTIWSLTYRAALARRRGDREQAHRLAQEGLEFATSRELETYIHANRLTLAWALAPQDPQAALKTALASMESLRASPVRFPAIWWGILPVADVLLGRGEVREACEWLNVLLDQDQHPPPDPLEAKVQALRDAPEPRAAAQAVLDAARSAGYL